MSEKKVEDRIRVLEDKVDYLANNLNFLAGIFEPLPKKKFYVGETVYRTFVWPYYERGIIKEARYSEVSSNGSGKPGWSYYISWVYNSNHPKSNPSESWWSEGDYLFHSLEEYKNHLHRKIDELVKPS